MTAPRIEVDLAKVGHNTRSLVARLAPLGISVTGVTKAMLGAPQLGRTLLDAGVAGLGDSRIENLERLRDALVPGPLTLIRSPMRSQADRVVASADRSCNTDLDVIRALSVEAAAQDRIHAVILMVELGDLREGILPAALPAVVDAVLGLPNIVVQGIGANLACRSGIVPDAANMGELSALAEAVEARFGIRLSLVSGGNSANLGWALGTRTGSGADAATAIGRIDDLRLGESILLGVDPVDRTPIPGLHTDAVVLTGEVIESITKPTRPWGSQGQHAFGTPGPLPPAGEVPQSILALGRQDVDPDDLRPLDPVTVLDASSDHLVVDAGRLLPIGSELGFVPGYRSLVRAMTSPFVATVFLPAPDSDPTAALEERS